MRKALIGGVMAGLLAAAVAGWLLWWRGSKPPLSMEELRYRQFLQTTASGHSGKMKSGTVGKEWIGYSPHWREGALQVHAGLSGPMGTPRVPVFLLLYRLAPEVPYAMTGGMMCDGNRMEITADQYAAEGKKFPFKWESVEKDRMEVVLPVSEPIKDRFHVGGKVRESSAGRVFLIDLTATPPAVQQHKADLDELFKGTGDEITKDDMQAIVERLSEWEPAVKDFLARIPKAP